MFLDVPKLSCRYQPTGQAWLISLHGSHKAFHFLSVSDSPTSILSDNYPTEITRNHLRVTYFRKTKNTCERCFWGVSETSRKRHLFWDIFETSYEIFLRRLKDVTKKTSFLRCFWEDSEISLSMEIWLRSLRDISCRLG